MPPEVKEEDGCGIAVFKRTDSIARTEGLARKRNNFADSRAYSRGALDDQPCVDALAKGRNSQGWEGFGGGGLCMSKEEPAETRLREEILRFSET